MHATLAYHWARMIEMLHAMEVIAELLDDAGPGRRRADRAAAGAAASAPRGRRRHRGAARHADPPLPIGDDDLISSCNLIVSTTHNNQAMNESVRAVAREYFDGREVTEGLLNHIEVAIRAYDPCLSCATHALGSMPLDVDLVGSDGALRDSVLRHGDGRFERVDSGHASDGVARLGGRPAEPGP